MSAICPLKVQKLAEKRNNQFLVSCRKTALLCDFWNISKLCKMRGGIFDSRTGHHTRLLTFGFIQPFVSIIFFLVSVLVFIWSLFRKFGLYNGLYAGSWDLSAPCFFFWSNTNASAIAWLVLACASWNI